MAALITRNTDAKVTYWRLLFKLLAIFSFSTLFSFLSFFLKKNVRNVQSRFYVIRVNYEAQLNAVAMLTKPFHTYPL